MNYYRHHIGDYDSHTAHLSWLEDCAYFRLLRVYYRTEKPIPEDLNAACRLVRANSKQERAAVQQVLNEFFELQADGWHQKRCDQEIADDQAFIAEQRRKGLASAASRRRKGSTGPQPNGNHGSTTVQQRLTSGSTISGSTESQPPTPTPTLEESKSANPPSAPEDFETRKTLFDLAKTILGASSGGLISKAISRTDEAHVAKVIGEMAAKPMADPRAYFVAATTPKERPRIVT